MGRKWVIALVVLVVLAALAVSYRHRIVIPLATSGAPIPQIPDANPTPGGQHMGAEKHFSVVRLDEATYAIAEPYSWARNVNYLILGDQRALLFDAGVGHYDIRPIVASLTDLPITFMPSHFHYDHTGQGDWANLAIVDLPHVRKRADGNRLRPTWGEHLGSAEAIELPNWNVSEWIKPNSPIELGNRSLVLLYTPGHTDNSVSLLDAERDLMFTGDFISDGGALSAIYPGSNLGDFLQSSEKVLRRTQTMQQIVLRGAHASPANRIPNSTRGDLETLRDQLIEIREGRLEGEGSYPVVYQIAEDMTLSTEAVFLHNWTPTYPDGHAVH